MGRLGAINSLRCGLTAQVLDIRGARAITARLCRRVHRLMSRSQRGALREQAIGEHLRAQIVLTGG